MITRDQFVESVSTGAKPDALSIELEALWYDAVGDWDKAHELAQYIPSPMGSKIHAYLHRKEGDQFNARYWYGQAGAKYPDASLEEEWENLLTENL